MQKWDAFIQHLRGVLGASSVEKWLRGVQVTKFDAHNIHLEVRDDFQIHWFREHISPLAKQHFKWGERPIRIHLFANSSTSPQPSPQKKPSRSHWPDHEGVGRATMRAAKAIPLKDVSPTAGQLLAHRLLTEIVRAPSSGGIQLGTYNPIFLFGPTGCGKSKLLEASAVELIDAELRVIALNGNAFTEDVVGAIRRGEMATFRDRYRSADVLIIEGVEQLGKKSATQEEFFHTFNTLHTAGKQIILSAPQHPQKLAAIEERLISRFEWGITVELTKATTAEVFEIAHRKLQELGLDLQGNALQALIDNLDGNLKTVMNALEVLNYKSALPDRHLEPSPSRAKLEKHLQEIVKRFRAHRATPQTIIDQVAAHFGILSADLIGKSQSREFTRPRRLAMYLCRSELHLPFVKIGEIFQRDHSTVMSNCRNIEQSLSLQKHLPDLQEVSLRLRELRA